MSHPYLRLPGNMAWPNPDALGDLWERLRHGGELSQGDRWLAASVVSAYRRALGTTRPSVHDSGCLTQRGLVEIRRLIHEALAEWEGSDV